MPPAIKIAELRTVAIESLTTTRSIVVMLHGYAMCPEDLSPFASSMRTESVFYFPQGPEAALPQGFAWWPIDQERRQAQLQNGPRDLFQEYPQSRPTIRRHLLQFIAAVRERHPSLPVVLAGFSQGGMLACDLALHESLDLAGMALLSTSRIAIDDWIPRLSTLRGLPVFVSHGRSDPDLAFAAGDALQSTLADAGATVTWLPFDGRHEIPLVVWRQLKRFIQSIGES
jgi:phospholipase/carboxylesterase